MTTKKGKAMTEGKTKSDTASEDFWKLGTSYFLRTVTHYYTGKLMQVTPAHVVLDDAAWVADTGRFGKALATGELNEVEPYPGRVLVAVGALVDACEWPHPLPRKAQ